MSSQVTSPAAAAGQFAVAGDFPVNRMGFGAMRVTGPGIWGVPKDVEESKHVLRRSVDLGVTLIDTSDAYGPEVSENLIAEALHPYPRDLLIATKGGLERPGPSQWTPNGRPEHLRDALEGSLRRLRLDCIALYQLHRPDPNVPLEESIGTLADLQREGKIRHIGVSNFDSAQLAQGQTEASIVSVQNRFNIGDQAGGDVVSRCEEQGIMFLPWGPLAQGRIDETQAQLATISERHGISPTQLALAWLLARSPVIVVIPGTSKVEHLEENVAAAGIELTEQEMAELNGMDGTTG